MKLFVRNLSIAAIVFSLASCGGADGTKIGTTGEKVAGSGTENTGEKKELSFKLNDVIQLGDYVVTVTKIVDNVPSPDEFTTPDAGKKFVAVEVLYENRNADKTLDYNPYDWKLIDSDSYNYEPDGSSAKDPTLEMGTLNPNQKARGWINFQVPKDAQRFKFQFQPNWLSNENVEVQLF